MYELFELVRLLTLRRQCTRSGPVEVTRFAWRENGEINILALFCSNDQVLLRLCVSGHPPRIKQLPWPQEKRVAAMCFDPTLSWLLMVTDRNGLYIVPALALLDPTAQINRLWITDDCTVIPVMSEGVVCAACWWHTLDDRQVAILSTKIGELLFVDLLASKILSKVTMDIQVMELALIQDDSQMSTTLLMTAVSSIQWKLLLEARTHTSHFSPDSDINNMGYINIDAHTIPPQSVLDCAGENAEVFVPERISHSHPWIRLSPQYARGRHFVTAHDQKTATLQVYNSQELQSPLFVYKLPHGVENVILTDRLTFTLSHRNGFHLMVLSNQRAETSLETHQEFNNDSVLQQLGLPAGEQVLGLCHRTFPFYWHDKLEEDHVMRLQQSLSLEQPSVDSVALELQTFSVPVTSHTVLDGCLIITEIGVYECRPRTSPERLFLQHALLTNEISIAEHLAISVGLDLTTLAEVAADNLLHSGHVSRAIRLYSLSKCSHLKRCASLARYERIQEMVTLLKHALQNHVLDLSSKDRKIMADLLLLCFIYSLAYQSLNISPALSVFRDFLSGSFSFDENLALHLLAEFGLSSLLIDFAMGRGLVMDALDELVTASQIPLPLSLLTQLLHRGFSAHVLQVARGALLSSLPSTAQVKILLSRPELLVQQVRQVKRQVTSLDSPLLLQLSTILDPSQDLVHDIIRHHTVSINNRTSSLTSLSSIASDGTDMTQESNTMSLCHILELFLLTVLHINHNHGNQHESLSLEQILTDVSYSSGSFMDQRDKKETIQRRLALQFLPIACGTYHTAVVRDGDLYTWGRTQHGRLGHGDLVREGAISGPALIQLFHLLQIRVEAVACGGEHTLAITQQGVYGWGNSRYGQVGFGTRHTYHRPMLLETLLSHTCVAIHCGQYHSLALTEDNQVYSWGWGVHGQLGHGDPEDQLVPKSIQYFSDLCIIRLAAGYCHSLALSEKGEVWSFGCGYFGQLGIGNCHKRTLPTLIRALSDPVTVIGTKYFHSVAVTEYNQVFVWGCHPHNLRYSATNFRRSRQGSYTVGDGMEMFNVPAPVDTTFIHSKIIQVSCGSLHTLLLTVEGEVYVWGRNLEGQLGIGNRQDERVPKMLTRINDQHIIYLSCGNEFNVILDSDFSLWAWGKNDCGQLGLTKSDNSAHPSFLQNGQHYRYTSSSIPDVIVPTHIRGLPPVNLLNQIQWQTNDSGAVSAVVNEICWVETRDRDKGHNLLPQLQQGGSGDCPYNTAVIPLVLKALGDLCDSSAILQYCVDLHDWFTAAKVCMIEDRHLQALLFMLLGLSNASKHLSAAVLTDLSAQVVTHYLRQMLENGGGMVYGARELAVLCSQILEHWLQHNLPISNLQHILEPHLPCLAPHLATLLFRPSQAESGRKKFPFYANCHLFTTTFCMKILEILISGHNYTSEQMVASWIKSEVSGTLPDVAAVNSGASGVTVTVEDSHNNNKTSVDNYETKLPLPLQPESQLVPFQRLWQDIVRSVTKWSPAASTIALTHTHLNHLTHIPQDQFHSPDSEKTSSKSVVVFSCGHHFTQASFLDTIMSGLALDQKALTIQFGIKTDRLPASLELIHQYYIEHQLLPLACPKCVLNYLFS